MHTVHETLERDAAVNRYAPLVRKVATRMVAKLPANVELDDLVQAGMIGLVDALSRYQSDKGAQFETFAMQRIRGAMLDELRDADWLPRSVRRNQRAIERAISTLEQRLRRAPSEREVAAELGMPIEQYRHMLGDARGLQLVCLDDMTDQDSEDAFIERFRIDPDADPSQRLRDDRFRSALIAAVEQLPERERMVMGMYYEREMSLKEIGAVFGVSESRISQLHSQAVAQLRVKLRGWA